MPQGKSSAEWHKARSGDGTQIAWRLTRGEGQQRFLLLHSLAMDGTFWDETASFLADHGDVLVLDCRGHGRSDKPAGPYSVELFADDVAMVMDAAGWSSAVVAGASMGGCVALAFASAYPARVQGLGLIDTTAWYDADAIANWEDRGQKARSEGLASMVEFQKSRWLGDAFRAAHPQIVEAAVAVFTANDTAAYLESCRMLGRCDMRQSLGTFSFPVEIIVGSEDYATPLAMAEAMRKGITGAQLNVLEGARHFTPLERPGEVAAILSRLGRAQRSRR